MTYSTHDPESRPLAYLDLLPPVARKKYRRLEQSIVDAGALQRAIMARNTSLEDRYYSAAQRAKFIDRKREPDRLAEIERELRELSDEREQARVELNRRNGMRANAEQILSRLRGYLASDALFRDALYGVRAYSGAAARPNNGEALSDEITRVRLAISRTQGELAQVRNAPPALAEVTAQVTAQINQWAWEGNPKITFNGDTVNLHWPDEQKYALPGSALAAPSGGASKLLVWALREQILARLLAGAEAATAGGIPADERARRVAQLQADLRQHEYDEEALVAQALEQGVEVYRRVDAHPFALLGIEAIDEATALVEQTRAKKAQAKVAEVPPPAPLAAE
jgi:hypothetical protein